MLDKIKEENTINTKEKKNELLEYLKLNFPQSIKDGQVDLKAIAMLLGLNNKEIRGYELSFTGKALANALYDTPNTKELKFHKSLSKDSQSTKNAIIKGDNLHALKLLKSAYYEKIKMIYIDPPYNTKNDKFIYNDDFVKEHKKLLIEVGLLEITEEGEEIRSEILNFFINAKSDRSHSAWLGFMLPRLKLARDLLREDGVIFISIDDNEQANLKILCDEIFGEENFVACLCIVDNLKGNNNTDGISQTNEYCLIYAKNREILKIDELKIQEDDDNLQKWNIDDFGYWKEGRNIKGTGENAPREKRPSMFYPIYLNDNMEISLEKNDEFYIEVLPLTNGKEMCWNWGKEFLKNNKHELIVKKTENGFNFIKKQRPSLGDLPSKKIKTTCYSPKYSTSVSSNTIKELFDNESIFNYSKSIYLIKDLLQISTSTKSDDIVLDFFAGSGTTAQAVMELNAEDNGNRKFILVQLDEKIDEKKSKVAYDFCKNELGSKNPVISDITIERVKRAGEKILKENRDKNLDLGFKVFSLVEKPELTKDDLNTLNLKYHENLTPYEKALNLALQDDKTLDKDLKMILKDKLYGCEDCFYILNCDDEVLEFLRKTQNENVYINGYDDINLEDYLNLESFLKERLKMVY
ncbi:site-specific DNA-methyltransferase [Campylobacter jejuni]|uniref:site-specific DNA-methyltransferase n=1 Tax=Campylobacter jejuni TaxID=197 RepID=UPI0027E191AE|nr:site-specific DNA-methyltransferase [Campylobacter jejuni]MDQ6376451.1 site-specific DNA-methyltransferase [Campylobacter jejuni]MDQ6379782.1 site-specific DNA-methyltransferase [Campylobacter jejuni]MDQ6381397.1 site-specific DNA-methyltransferase [Campylobacter jejuni]